MHECNSWYNKRDDCESNFKDFSMRLKSFSTWPKYAPVAAQELANAGWFYTGLSDRVQCAWCNGVVYNWEEGDTGFGEHHKHYPNCDFLKQSMVTVFDEDPSDKIDNKTVELEKELRQLKNEIACKSCKKSTANVLFVPCRHLICCEVCAARIKYCPVCFEFIDGTVVVLNSNVKNKLD